jgi:hypothetical protein
MNSLDRSTLKRQAIIYRKHGKSYAEITQKLGVPKSTLSGWLRDIPFSEKVKYDNILKAKRIWARNLISYNEKRGQLNQEKYNLEIDLFASQVPKLTTSQLFFLGMGIYLGEGGKRDKRSARLSNANSDIIILAMRFFRECCNVQTHEFRPWVHIHPNINPEEAIKYWAEVTKVPSEQIRTQLVVSRASKGKRLKDRLPYGTLHIRINRAHVMRRIHGWMKGLINQSMPE